MTTKTHPLAGVRVLDLSHVLAAPFCTRILSDLGAEVIKIEAPSGDLARKLGARRGGMSGYFMQQNCGKRNVSIDIKTEAGRELVARLAESSDIFVENFRPGVLDELGLGQEKLRARNPGLIYCAISGFGHDSPLRDQRAFAGVAHAATGMLHRQAAATKRAPTDSVLAVGDTVTGLQAVIAILAALHQRDLTGSGQFVDMAMHDALLAIQEAANFSAFGGDATEEDFLCAWTFKCGDGYVVCPPDPRVQWKEYTELIGRPELVDDERYDTYEKRIQRLAGLEKIIANWMRKQPSADDVVAAFHRAGLACARIATLSEALGSEQVQHRRMTRELDDRSGGTVAVLDSPYRFSDAESGVRGRPAFRGEHNRQVLADILGLDDATVDRLEADGTISSRVPDSTD